MWSLEGAVNSVSMCIIETTTIVLPIVYKVELGAKGIHATDGMKFIPSIRNIWTAAKHNLKSLKRKQPSARVAALVLCKCALCI